MVEVVQGRRRRGEQRHWEAGGLKALAPERCFAVVDPGFRGKQRRHLGRSGDFHRSVLGEQLGARYQLLLLPFSVCTQMEKRGQCSAVQSHQYDPHTLRLALWRD